MQIQINVNIGEALDKLSLLEIKKSEKFEELSNKLESFLKKHSSFYKTLRNINTEILSLSEDIVQSQNSEKLYKIFETNDRKIRIKNKIDNMYNQHISNTNVKKCMLIPHLGLGDMINMIGAIRYLSSCYDEIVVFCKERNIENMKLFLEDDPTIDFFVVPNNFHAVFTEPYQNFNGFQYRVLACGLHDGTKPFVEGDFPLTFYRDINLDTSIISTYFFVNENHSVIYKEQIPFPYIFVHDESSTENFDFKNIISSNLTIINPNRVDYQETHPHYDLLKKLCGKPLIFYKEIIENATEIYTTDSSFLCLANRLDTSKVTKFVCFSRQSRFYTSLKSQILQIINEKTPNYS